MSLNRGDLLFEDYNWNTFNSQVEPRVIVANDPYELDRNEGYEMLYFIKSLVTTWQWKKPFATAIHHLERVIRTEVPAYLKTFFEIECWLRKRYVCFG